MTTTTQTTFCRICESLCGLEVITRDGVVTEVHPDTQHVATRGFSCPKGLKQHKMYDSPDRLRYPEKRVGDRWERISWTQALDEIGAKVKQLRGDHGADAIAMYIGTAAGFGVLHPVFAQGFMTGVGSKSMYSSSTQDCSNKFAVAREMYGFPFTQPFPDLDRTGCLIIVGANPVISKWSFLQVPNPGKTLQEMQARGAKIFVVDPRLTETARAAGEHVFIRPGTDVFFYLAFLNELIRQGGIDRARVAEATSGFEQLQALAQPWTPERCAEVTQIPAARLRELVTAYRTAKGAALYCSTGVNMGANGAMAFWIQEAINAASGNLDRPGGTLVGEGVIDFPAFGKKSGTLLRDDRSRIGNLGSINDAFPGGILADEILTPGDRQVRALFVSGGNPLITMANAGRLRDAFGTLELLVTLDIYKNETGSLAHYVLPCTSPMERPDLPFIFPLMLGLQKKPYLQATLPVVPTRGEERDEATIYLELCRASGVSLFKSKIAQVLLRLMVVVNGWFSKATLPSLPQQLLLSLLLRVTGQGSFKALLAHRHGRPRPPHGPTRFVPDRVLTADRKVALAPAKLLEMTAKLPADFERERQNGARLKLITKRAVGTHNSWTHNIEDFVGGERQSNYLYVNPIDAQALGLKDGDIADVTTRTATVRVPVKLLGDLMPGSVALPHGWGHQHATGLSIASKTAGVNVNLLAADGPEGVEALSGMVHLTGFLVDVKKAQGPRDVTQWNGLPPSAPAGHLL